MTYISDGSGPPPSSFNLELSSTDVSMDLTGCGLLVDRVEMLTELYAEHGNWNDVREQWFSDRLAERSTRGSAQKIYRILSSRLKNAPETLPNPSDLPSILQKCKTTQNKAQILYFYLVADDLLVQHVVQEYVSRFIEGQPRPLDFSNETLVDILTQLTYSGGGSFEYADSTTERWCIGFRSVMRKIGVLEGRRSVIGKPPNLGDIPLLVAMDYSYGENDELFISPRGLLYAFQPEDRWEELFDRAVRTDVWEYLELHGDIDLRPIDEPYSWIHDGGEI